MLIISRLFLTYPFNSLKLASNMEPKDITLDVNSIEYELNETETLQEEESRAKYDARMEELDRRDKAGPHYRYR